MDTCPDCAFSYGELPRHRLAATVGATGRAYASRLTPDDVVLHTRPSPGRWSPLEYACHVRDVLLMQRDRLYVALVEDEPSFKPMYREERVTFDRYGHQRPAAVVEQVAMAADLMGNALDGLADAQWGRSLIYGFPGPTRRDVEWVAHHTLHEMVHHLGDIDQMLDGA
jgi:DinB superfamily